jgi:hypothetical protein
MVFQNCLDRKHPDAVIQDFTALLDKKQDAMHYLLIYNGALEFMPDMSCNKTYISDDYLHQIELCIYNGIKVHVEGLEGALIYLMCRCTRSQSSHMGNRCNNWVGVKQCPGWCYGALNRHLL